MQDVSSRVDALFWATAPSPPIAVGLPEERAMGTELQIGATIDGSKCLVRLTGELDAATCMQLRTAMREICAAEHRQVVIDMGGLSFPSLAGLRVLSDVQPVLDGIGCRLVRANPN